MHLLRASKLARATLVAASYSMLACGQSAPTSESHDVVGGRAEEGYPSFGYLVKGSEREDLEMDAFCGGTLIRPDVVVTAAHCISNPHIDVHAWGTGKVGSAAPHIAKKVVVHPSYTDKSADPTQVRFDMALMLLEAPVEGIEPAVVVAPQEGCGARHFGYGRTTTGGAWEDGKTGERKSAAMCVDFVDEGIIWAHGVDGGTCWGDSGSPIMIDGRAEVMGVLHGAANRTECFNGKSSTYAALEAERATLACLMTRAASDEPADKPLFEDTLCHWAETFIAGLVELQAVDGPKADDARPLFDPNRVLSRAELATLVTRAFALLVPPEGPGEGGGSGGSGGGEGGSGQGGGEGGAGGAGGVGGATAASTTASTTSSASASAGGGATDEPSDVSATHKQRDAIRAALAAGFFRLEEGKFKPSATMTRAEVLAALARGLELRECDNFNPVGIIDSKEIDAALEEGVNAALSEGIATNFPSPRRLRPGDHATRADAMSFVQRALVRRGKATEIPSRYAVPGCQAQ